jgi:hypothetical protein
MAEKMAPDQRDGEDGELTNAGARTECIQKAMRDNLSLDQREALMIEKYVAPIREERRKLKQGVKADTGIELRDYDLNYKLWKRQEEAKQMDEDDRDRILDNLREAFGALQSGDMLDFVDVLDAA